MDIEDYVTILQPDESMRDFLQRISSEPVRTGYVGSPSPCSLFTYLSPFHLTVSVAIYCYKLAYEVSYLTPLSHLFSMQHSLHRQFGHASARQRRRVCRHRGLRQDRVPPAYRHHMHRLPCVWGTRRQALNDTIFARLVNLFLICFSPFPVSSSLPAPTDSSAHCIYVDVDGRLDAVRFTIALGQRLGRTEVLLGQDRELTECLRRCKICRCDSSAQYLALLKTLGPLLADCKKKGNAARMLLIDGVDAFYYCDRAHKYVFF